MLVKFEESPTCVRLSGAPSIVELQSCFSDNWAALIRTGDLFNETVAGEFRIIVDGNSTAVRYGKPQY